MTIVKRETKGSALTYGEMDENIRDLYEDTDLQRVLTNGNTTDVDIITSGQIISSLGVSGPGSTLQTKFVKIGPDRLTISNANATLIPGFELELTPESDNSLFIIEANISTTATYVTSFGVYANHRPGGGSGTFTPLNDTGNQTNNNEPHMNFTMYQGHNTVDHLYNLHLLHVDDPPALNPGETHKFQIRATSAWTGGVRTLYINNRNANDMASFSTLKITEVEKS